MKKIISVMLILALLTCAVFAKGSSDKSSKTSDGKIELTFWSLFTGGDGEFFDAMIDEFNRSQNEIVAKNDLVKFDDYYTKLTTALAAKTAPDVIVVHQANMPNYVNGSLLALDDYVTPELLADFQEIPLEACRFNGKLYSLPFDVHPIILYYNKDILEEAGITEVPENIDEFLDAAMKIKENTDKWPFVIDNTTGVYKAYTLTRLFFSMMYQQGGSFLNDDNSKAAFNNEMGENALDILKNLVAMGLNPNELDYDAAMNMFKLGEAAFYFNGVWATGTLEEAKDLNFGAAPLPAFFGNGDESAWAGSHTLAIPVQKNQDPAKIEAGIKFIDWMTGHGELWAKAGNIPTRKSVTAKSEFTSLPYRADYAAAAAYALGTPTTPAWEEIYETCSDMLEAAVTKNQDTKTALDAMEKKVNEIIASY